MTSLGPPVVLIHGMGSTFEHNWRRHGWVDLLEAEGRTVVPFELPGHGHAPLLAGPDDTGSRRLASLCEQYGVVDVVAFSAGSVLALTTAVERPELFGRLALLGLGDAQLRTSQEQKLESLQDMDAPVMRGVRLAASRAGNDVRAVLEFAATTVEVPSFESLARVAPPVLLVLGELDFLADVDQLLEALPDVRLAMLRDTDHFSTTQRFEAKMAVLDFLVA